MVGRLDVDSRAIRSRRARASSRISMRRAPICETNSAHSSMPAKSMRCSNMARRWSSSSSAIRRCVSSTATAFPISTRRTARRTAAVRSARCRSTAANSEPLIDKLRPPLAEVTIKGMAIGSGQDLAHFFNATRSLRSAWHVTAAARGVRGPQAALWPLDASRERQCARGAPAEIGGGSWRRSAHEGEGRRDAARRRAGAWARASRSKA